MKRWLSLFLSVLMMVTMLPASVIASTSACSHSFSAACDTICDWCGYDRSDLPTLDEVEPTEPTIVASNAVGRPGDTVQVTISMKNNPGIVSALVRVGYDASALTLIEYQAGDFSASGYSWSVIERNPFTINWCYVIRGDETAELLATLTFRINADAAEGAYPITLTYDNEGDIFDANFDTVIFGAQESVVYVGVGALKDHTYENACDSDCDLCGATREVEPHAYVGKVTQFATCVEDGVKTYTCSVCGDSYTEAIPATGPHTYVGKVTKPASCVADGVKTYTCPVCDDSYTEVIPATGVHDYSADCDIVCNVCGYDRSDLPTFDEVEPTKPTIVVSNAVGRPGDTVQITISMKNNPGISSVRVMVGYDTSALTLMEYEAGDFTAPGYSWGMADRSPFVVNWLDMRAGNVTAELLATLTFRINAGATEGAYPITLAYDNEGDIFDANFDTVIFGAQESVVYVDTLKEHTYDNACDDVCDLCGATREGEPHTYVGKVTQVASCVAEGVKTYTCSVCGDSYTEAIPTTDEHVYDNACDAFCNVCGAYREVEPHAYVKQVTVPGDCMTDETSRYVCSVCGDTYYETIPARGVHTYDAVCDAICNLCGYDRSRLPAYDDVTVTKPTIVVGGAAGQAGDTVQVTISMKNNPGIVSAKVKVGYDATAMTLVAYENGDFSLGGYGNGALTAVPFVINWCDAVNPDNNAELFATLTFKIHDDAAEGEYPITLTYDNEGDIFNTDWETVCFDAYESSVYVSSLQDHSYAADCDTVCDVCGFERTNVTFDEVEFTEPTIVVGGAAGKPGDTVQVTISLKNNPGIVSAKVKVGYDSSALTLIDYERGDFSAGGYSWGSKVPFVINWCDAISGDDKAELLATLTFEIKEGAAEGAYPITLEYSCEDDFYNTNWDTIEFGSYESFVYVSTVAEHTYANACDRDCDLCGAIREAQSHVYVGKVTQSATCVVDGMMTYTCSVCGDSYTQTIPATGAHDYSVDCDTVCDVCGYDRSDLPTLDEVEVTEPTIVVGGAAGKPGDTVQVTISMKNNPGIVSAKVLVGYDPSALTLVKYEAGDFSASGYSWGPIGNVPFVVNWCDAIHPNSSAELLATLTFEINDSAADGVYPITLDYNANDIFDYDWALIRFDAYESFVLVSTLKEHTYTNECDESCNLCGAIRVVGPHTYVSKITKPATCAVDGVMTYTCSVCGDSYTEVIPATGDHNYVGEVTQPATCVVDGVKTYTCSVCGDSYTEAIPATGEHTYVGEVTKPATCAVDGVKTYTCSVCGDSYTEAIPATGKHTYVGEITKPATCAVDGVMTYTCSVCSRAYTEAIPATGKHTYVGEITKPATCAVDGVMTYTCSVCDHAYTEVIPATGDHTYVGEVTKPATCVEDGVKTYTCSVCSDSYTEVIPATGIHTYSVDCDTLCDVCGYDRSDLPSLDEVEVTEPTIVVGGAIGKPGDTVQVTISMKNNPGIISTKVLVGYDTSALTLVKYEAGDFSAAGYSWGPIGNVPFVVNWCDAINPNNSAELLATLTFEINAAATDGVYPITLDYNAGDIFDCDWAAIRFDAHESFVLVSTLKEHTYNNGCDESCNLCGAIREVDPHAYASEITKPATCAVDGVMTYTCSVCGDSYTEAIPATGDHTYVGEVTQPASCVVDGVKTFTCSVCGDSYTEVIPAIGYHTYASEITKPATCAVDGVMTYTCSVCGDSYTEAIPATGKHTYVGEITKPATCAVDGVMTYTCSVCSRAYTEAIPATGKHTYVGEITKPASCVVDGVKTFTCSVCGDSYTEVIPAIGYHTYVSEITKPATCAVDGVMTYTCSVCSRAYTEAIPATGKHTYVGEITKPATCVADGVKTYTCSVCADSYTEAIPAVGSHSYAAVCDAVCDVCGYDRSDLPTYGDVEVTKPTIVVGGVVGKPGDTVQVTVSLKNNPGIVSAKVLVGYDVSALTLVKYEAGNFSASGYSWGQSGTIPFVINWCDAINGDNKAELLATLTFEIKEGAADGEYPIALTYSCEDDFYNTNWDTVEFASEDSSVYVSTLEEHAYVEEITVPATCVSDGVKTFTCSVCGDSYTEVIRANGAHTYRDDADHDCDQCGHERAKVGDPNGDGRVNNRDLGLMQQYLNNWSVDVIYAAFDLNDDGRVNNRDLGLLQQYLNGWNVKLK